MGNYWKADKRAVLLFYPLTRCSGLLKVWNKLCTDRTECADLWNVQVPAMPQANETGGLYSNG